MKMLAVITEDFAFYHDLVRRLRRRGMSFVSLGLGEPVPGMVSVALTTSEEAGKVGFEPLVVVEYAVGEESGDALDEAIDRVKALLAGKKDIGLLVVGVDPGKRPGIAVLADASLMKVDHAASPEEVGGMVRRIIETYSPSSALVRLGDGAPTERDRIVNSIAAATWDMPEPPELELVDEKNSSGAPHTSDTEAAMKIALTPGRTAPPWREVTPSDGEVREMQRRSRIISRGEVTISRELARLVLLGELTMEEAVGRQRGHS